MRPGTAWWRRARAVDLRLTNVAWHSEGEEGVGDLRLGRGRILERGERLAPRRGERALDGEGYVALPGLVNAHDHLALDLHPPLGRPPYPNLYAWAREIYRPEAAPLRDLARVSLADRLAWGGYRNLAGGVTTVVHHDPYHAGVFRGRFPVRVLEDYAWAHSLGFGEGLLPAFARAGGRPYIVHAAEGTDAVAAGEVPALDRLGVLGPATVLVHAVAVTPEQIARLGALGVSVVWCPASNLRLYGRTAPVPQLAGRVRLALGTDSTLSGSPTLLHELAVARGTGLATPAELLAMVTTGAAGIFRLADGRGTLRPGAPADLVLLPRRGAGAADALLAATPADVALVLVGGAPRLADPLRAAALGLGEPAARVAGRPTWLAGDLAALRRRIARAAGEAALAGSPTWALLEAAA